jgi:hypothetical protein
LFSCCCHEAAEGLGVNLTVVLNANLGDESVELDGGQRVITKLEGSVTYLIRINVADAVFVEMLKDVKDSVEEEWFCLVWLIVVRGGGRWGGW